jgi:peptidyl-prolyl cis-trans isomerase SurA
MNWKLWITIVSLSFLSLNAFSQNVEDEIILTVGDEKVTRAEFERIFHKNNQMVDESAKKSLDEYVELFVKYKLKVVEAKAEGLDKKESFIKELDGYKKQLSQPFLTDTQTEKSILDEAYQRMRYEVSASHILVSVPEKATPEDTLAIYNKVLKIRERITKGEAFEEVARATSDDPSVKRNSGFLGYFTAFQMVYPFESAAYKTPIGNVSAPVRTQFGYHIIKVHDIRPAKGQIKVAHIMVATPRDGDVEKENEAKSKIEDIYKRVLNNEDFAALAREFSQDPGSARNGGELPLFGSGRMVPEFEQAAFGLKTDGQISVPVRTQFGWHIIKRIEKKDVGSFDEMLPDIKQKISRDPRAQLSRNNFINNLKKKHSYKLDSASLKAMYKMLDSSIYKGEWKPKQDLTQKHLFEYAGVKFSMDALATKIGASPKPQKQLNYKTITDRAFNSLVEETIVNEEESRLSKENPEFFYLMKEYYEGILLFEITDRNVWSKSTNDTEGLTEFFNNNIKNYSWEKRFHGITITAANEKTLAKAQKLVTSKKGMQLTPEQIVQKFVVKNDTLVKATKVTFDPTDPKVQNHTSWAKGVSPVQKSDNEVSFIKLVNITENEPKQIEDVRGQVIADYQEFLENSWIKQLREKHQVVVNQDVLNKLKVQ